MHEDDLFALAHCIAIAVARDNFDTASLMEIGHKVGFGAVVDAAGFAGGDWPAHKLIFFLVHYGLSVAARRALLDRVRHASTVNICFAPVVLFVQDGQGEEAQDHIEMGFDDIVRLPAEARMLSAQLARQIGQEHHYVETRSYLGPDRRRLEPEGHNHPERRGQSDYTSLVVYRSPEQGVEIRRRELVRGR